MGSISRYRQAERFIKAFGSFLLEQSDRPIGKKYTLKNTYLSYDEVESKVILYYTFEDEDGVESTFTQGDVLFDTENYSTKEDIQDMIDPEDEEMQAAFEIYQSWVEQYLNPDDLPYINRENSIRVRNKLKEVNLV